jgi:hypothetical protein
MRWIVGLSVWSYGSCATCPCVDVKAEEVAGKEKVEE